MKAYKNDIAKFLIKNKAFKIKAEKAGLFKKAILEDVTNQYLDVLDAEFIKKFGKTFTTQFKKKKKNDEQKENPSITKQKQSIQLVKEANIDIMNQWKETSVERLVTVCSIFVYTSGLMDLH